MSALNLPGYGTPAKPKDTDPFPKTSLLLQLIGQSEKPQLDTDAVELYERLFGLPKEVDKETADLKAENATLSFQNSFLRSENRKLEAQLKEAQSWIAELESVWSGR